MILLYGVFGLGIAELVIVIIALLLLLSPKDFALIKPIVKSVYRGWLEYRGEVVTAQKDMEELKHSVMMPLEEAEREVERELIKSKADLSGMRKSIAGAGLEMRRDIGRPVQDLRGGISAAGKEIASAGRSAVGKGGAASPAGMTKSIPPAAEAGREEGKPTTDTGTVPEKKGAAETKEVKNPEPAKKSEVKVEERGSGRETKPDVKKKKEGGK